MFIKGETLEDIDADNLSSTEAREIKRCIYRLYEKIQAYGVCHNDISLSNIMYDPEAKKVYLIDFGDSRTLNKSVHDFITIGDDYCNDKENVKQSLDEWSEKANLE